MKGIIFNLLEDFIVSRHGEEIYEDIVETCDTGELDPFEIVSPGSYPDEVFDVIVRNAAKKTATPLPALLKEMGRHALPKLAKRYPHFFTPYTHPRDFLKTASMIHHVEVKKLYQGAEVPKFFVDDKGPEGLALTYKSRRHLCHLVEGLVDGLGTHYHVPLSVEQVECVLTGHDACTFNVQFLEHGTRQGQ